jgi:hypothetical protein
VGRRDALMMLANRNRLSGLQKPARTVGELFEIHLRHTPYCWGRYGVADQQHKGA